jgi:hypothetical protein
MIELTELVAEEGEPAAEKTFAALVRDAYSLADSLRLSGNVALADELNRETDEDVRGWLTQHRRIAM